MSLWRYCVPTAIYFGRGLFARSGELVHLLGQQPLLVTGRNFARQSGVLEQLLEQVPGAVVFDEVEENPGLLVCERGGALARARGCDSIIALGGGSAMDAAKAIAILATNSGRCEDFIGAEKYTVAPLPIAAIPTTSGTGSEVTPYAVLVRESDNTKRSITGAALYPRLAICDPELTLSMPRAVTAATGLDALSQCMEGFVSRASTPLGDVLALEGCRLVREFLPRAIEQPDDLEAREQIMFAALLSGCVIAQSGTTIVHGMGYAYTCHFGIAHGLANALLLAPVFRHNALYNPVKVARLAEALGAIDAATDPSSAIVECIHAVLNACGVDPSAAAHGAERDRLFAFAEELWGDSHRFKNQIGEFSLESLHALYLASLDGRA